MPRAVQDQDPPIGTQGNFWNGVATGTSAPTSGVDTKSASVVSIFGHGSGAATFNIYYSADNVNFYDTGQTITLAGAADFSKDITPGARYIGIKSSANITATLTIQAK